MAINGYKKIDTSDDNILSLADYLSMCNSDMKLEDLFLHMDMSMKKLHINNYHINSFRISDIYIYDNGNYLNVYYSSVDKGCNSSIKQKNIFYLSCLSIGVYSGCLHYINPSNPEFLKENFNEFAQLIPESSVAYYRGVISRNSSVYYSDFVAARRNQEMASLQSLDDSSRGKSGNVLTKSTLIGKMNALDDIDQSAFISILLFPIIILCISFIIPFLIVFFS